MRVAIGLGSNLGDRLTWLHLATARLCQLPECEAWRFSSVYETTPVDCSSPLLFLNAAATVETTLAPSVLLAELQAIETALDRQRPHRNAPRTIDLDLLLIGDLVLDTSALTIPHPRMAERLFVLAPLAEIAPEWWHPTRRCSVADLYLAQANQTDRPVKTDWYCEGA